MKTFFAYQLRIFFARFLHLPEKRRKMKLEMKTAYKNNKLIKIYYVLNITLVSFMLTLARLIYYSSMLFLKDISKKTWDLWN